jgi:hypothetical protein
MFQIFSSLEPSFLCAYSTYVLLQGKKIAFFGLPVVSVFHILLLFGYCLEFLFYSKMAIWQATSMRPLTWLSFDSKEDLRSTASDNATRLGIP